MCIIVKTNCRLVHDMIEISDLAECFVGNGVFNDHIAPDRVAVPFSTHGAPTIKWRDEPNASHIKTTLTTCNGY